MRTKSRLLSSVMIMSIALTSCHRKVAEPNANAGTPLSQTSEVTITELEPDGDLYRALESFAKGENKVCAADMTEGASAMRTIAESSKVPGKSRILESAKQLDSLAARISAGEITDVGPINTVLGQVGRSLAQFRLTVTENEVFKQSEGKTGKLLATTIHNLEKSITLHHRALNAEEKQVLGDAMSLAEQLEQGTKVDEDDLKMSLQQVNQEINKWNKEFDPHQPLSSNRRQ